MHSGFQPKEKNILQGKWTRRREESIHMWHTRRHWKKMGLTWLYLQMGNEYILYL